MKSSIPTILFILALTMNALPALSQDRHNNVNWIAGNIEAVGSAKIIIKNGHPVDPENHYTISINKSRMIAYRRAKEDAKIQLIALIKKIRIDSDKTMSDLLQQSKITRMRLSQIVDNNIIFMQYPFNYYNIHCMAKIKISDILPAIPYMYPLDNFPTPQKNPVKTKYSGLIIDTRGLNIPAMILPVIYNEYGLEIYSKNFIDPKFAAKYGLVSYVYTDREAQKHFKAGDRPYYTVALENSKGCPVIADKDARRLLSSPKTIAALKQCRVIFIIDRGQ